MAEFFTSGLIVDFILIMVVIEAALLAIYHHRTGKGLAPAEVAGFLLSGLFLLLALRAALAGAWWGWISLCLTGALLTHVLDLAHRWRRTPPGP